MDNTKSAQTDRDTQARVQEIDNRYGRIGISAVAAAMRFQGETRNSDSYRFETFQRD